MQRFGLIVWAASAGTPLASLGTPFWLIPNDLKVLA